MKYCFGNWSFFVTPVTTFTAVTTVTTVTTVKARHPAVVKKSVVMSLSCHNPNLKKSQKKSFKIFRVISTVLSKI